jgi:hypothetical protein
MAEFRAAAASTVAAAALEALGSVPAQILAKARGWSQRIRLVLDRFQPHAVITASGASVDARLLELAARRRGIRSLHLQHGLYEADPLTAHLQATHVCLWGEHHRRQLAAHPPRGELVVTGSPHHDELLARLAEVPQDDPPHIVYYTPRAGGRCLSREGYAEHLRAFRDAAASLPRWRFTAKLHPADDEPFARACLERWGPPANLRVTRTEDPYPLLRRAAVAVVYSSTVGFEAILLRRRLVILDLTNLPDWLPLAQMGLAVKITEAAALVPALRREVEQREQAPDPGGELWRADGRATERILELIEEA